MKEEVIQGDCLIEMQKIPDKSIDMILCDLPYQITACKWDTIIPFEPLWEQYKRIIKDNGAIVLTASQPFTSALVMSNVKMFKYEWVWDKVKPSTGLHAKIQPLRQHENILVFGNPKYYPIMEIAKDRNDKPRVANNGEAFGGKEILRQHSNNGLKYPRSLLKISNADQNNRLHPTQKPVALFEYLIKTYTNEGDLVLDNCAGSGTTGVACQNLKRDFILIEKEPKYVEIIKQRLKLCPTNPPTSTSSVS
jgi:site-specific DNA-methyltransferase (adenine-specific)